MHLNIRLRGITSYKSMAEVNVTGYWEQREEEGRVESWMEINDNLLSKPLIDRKDGKDGDEECEDEFRGGIGGSVGG